MENNFFIANKEQKRSILVSFCIFLIKEMYQDYMLHSNTDEIVMAQYYDNKIDKYINESKYRENNLLFTASVEQIRSIVVSFCTFLIAELYQENVLKSNADKQTIESYYEAKIDIYIKEKKYRKERL